MSAPEHPRRIAQRLVVGVEGPALRPDEAQWLKEYAPAGVILFPRNVISESQLGRLCDALHGLLPAGAEISADHEGGPVSVLSAAAGHPPAPRTLGQVDDEALTFEVFRDLARRARACGLDRLLAPCADVLGEPLNPVIGSRAFGSDPDLVARHVRAAVRGAMDAGVGVCLKHWPGHGDTALDPHLELEPRPVPDRTGPFLEGLRAGAGAVMVGHLPGGDRGLPATLDADAVKRLRRRAPSGCLILSDDITMGALRPAISELAGRDYGDCDWADPRDLDALWIETVAAAGHDRLLCRGIPRRAFPLPERIDVRTRPGTDPEPEAPPSRIDPESWTRARDRAAEPGLGPVDAPLDWLDGGDTHRWPSLELADIRAAGWTGRVREIRITATDPAGVGADRLLVTSQAPLPETRLATICRNAPERGICLVMGHPSLCAAMTAVLPSNWLIRAAFDSNAKDLAPFLSP